MLAEPSALSSVDAAAASLEDVHLQNAGLAGDSFGDGTSSRGDANGDVFELRGGVCHLSETANEPSDFCNRILSCGTLLGISMLCTRNE